MFFGYLALMKIENDWNVFGIVHKIDVDDEDSKADRAKYLRLTLLNSLGHFGIVDTRKTFCDAFNQLVREKFFIQMVMNSIWLVFFFGFVRLMQAKDEEDEDEELERQKLIQKHFSL